MSNNREIVCFGMHLNEMDGDIGFIAPTQESVHAFYKAALTAGGVDDVAPGSRLDYGQPYYGCFVYDPDSHKVEA